MNDPRGPIQKIVSVEKRPDAALVGLSCGHVARLNQIFSYRIGDYCHCFQCGQEAERQAS